MKTLILGNGFDLDHELPTKYTDFLSFIDKIKIFRNSIDECDLKWNESNEYVEKYIYELFFSDEKNHIKEELLHLLNTNIWLDYFFKIKRGIGENWIDFEAEISQVVQELENVKDFVIERMKNGEKDIRVPIYMRRKINNISIDIQKLIKDGNENCIYENITIWIEDIAKMIRLLEIYLCDYVQRYNIKYFSPDIYELNPDRIISFNYTNTYEKLYSYNRNNIKYNYIHGKVSLDNTVDTCNMVLGIEEYLEENKRNKKTEFIQFKKYFQRIHKRTDCEYVYWFDGKMEKEKQKASRDEIYIFGHSLDITDSDVLSKILNCPNANIIIYYYDEAVYGKQIANLVSLLGQELLLSKVNGRHPSIIFKHQQEHKLMSNSAYEVSYDMYKLRHLYEYNNIQAQNIVNSVINKIKNCNINYFSNQKNIVNMYNVLQDLGLAEENRSQLLSFAEVIYDDTLQGKKEYIDASQWEYGDYYGHHDCDSNTANFIKEINTYNMNQYEKQVFPIQNEIDEEEKHILYPEKLEDGYSLDDYEKTYQYAMQKMNSTTVETRKVLNALETIALHFEPSDIKHFYNEKKKITNNPILQTKINYILSCYDEDLYMRYQARQYEESLNI